MKGISSVITAVMLLSVSVALASMYAGWAPDLAANLTENAAEGAEQKTACRNAGLSIQDPVYDSNSNTFILTLKNTGTIRFTEEIELIAINTTRLGNTSVYGLSPGDKSETSFEVSDRPREVVARSLECPDSTTSRDDFEVRE